MSQAIRSWTEASDISSLLTFFRGIVAESPRVVDYMLVHAEPKEMLGGIGQILHSWDDMEDYGESDVE